MASKQNDENQTNSNKNSHASLESNKSDGVEKSNKTDSNKNENVANSSHAKNSLESESDKKYSPKEDLKNVSADSEEALGSFDCDEHNELKVIDDKDYERHAKDATQMQISPISSVSNPSLSSACKDEDI